MFGKFFLKSPLIVLILGIIIRLIFFFNKPFVGDELWTYYLVRNDFFTIVESSFADFHPPLYYLIIKIWLIIFGNSLVAIRFFSFICSVLFLIGIYFLARTWANDKAARWALLISALSAGYIQNAAYGRMYALGMLSVILVIWSIILYVKTGASKHLLFYAIAIILAVYTYAYLALLIISTVLFVGLQKKVTKQFILVHAFIFIFLIPFLFLFLMHIGNIQNFHPFVSDNKFKAIFLLASAFFPAEVLFLGVTMPDRQIYNYAYVFSLSIFIAVLVIQQCKRNFNTDGWFVICFSLIPVSLLSLFSLFYKSVLGIYPLIYFSVPLVVSLAKIVYTRFWMRTIMLILLVFSIMYYFQHLPLMVTDTDPYLYVKTHTKNNDLVLVQDIFSLLWLRYYADVEAKAIISTQYDRKVEQALQYELIPFRSLTAKRVILVEYTLYSGVHESQSLLKAQGYSISNKSIFREVTVSEFKK